MPQWLITLSWVCLALGLATAAVLAADIVRHRQKMKIMNIVWPVTGLYFPLIGWWFYKAAGRPMAIDAPKSAGPKPRWKSIFLSATHCASGCVIGDLIGAPIVFATGWALFGQRLFSEYLVEFALAYLFGIAFQYFPIRAMRRVSPYDAIKDAVKADTLSLTAFEVGMFAWMALIYFVLLASYRPDSPTPVFWFMMQVGMVLGFLTAYPANWLLIKWGVKSGM
ncbi:MAG: DUF4396 domain-containing protein [Proteobacteria bacterium]|nr:DUF4396 domain-containing protein [Pseudomonadota bacterium]